MKRFLYCWVLLLLTFSIRSYAQLPGLRFGKLPNGFTYYIMKDEAFADEVNFYLYKNIGAVLEDSHENGMCHFMEHLAFNSTEHFPHGVMKYLRDKGLVFNALTGINDTRFQINSVSTSNRALTDSLLLLVRDWCDGMQFSSNNIEKEKSIIIEERRQGRDLNRRLSEAVAPAIYNSSQYAFRNVIGTDSTIKEFSAKSLKKFYNKWYKPELHYIAIVGDIDLDYWENKVIQLFSDMPSSKSPLTRNDVVIEENKVPLYYSFIDKENTSNSLGIYQRFHKATDASKSNITKENILTRLFQELANRQFAVLRNLGGEDYIAAYMEYGPFVRSYVQNVWNIVPYSGREIQALEQVLRIRERIRQQGFSEQEFEEVKWALYKEMKSVLESENLGTPDNYMEIFKQHYLYNIPLQSFRDQMTEMVEELVEIEVDTLNQWVHTWMSNDENLSVITYASQKGGINISLDQFTSVLNKTKNMPLLTWTAPKAIENLIDFTIDKGEIVKSKDISELEAEEWELSNGAHVLYKYVPTADRRVFLVGSALGGKTAIAPKDLPSYEAMKSLLMKSGLYHYDRNQLHLWCQKSDLELSLSLAEQVHGIGGNAALKNTEKLFQYLYLVIARQKFDQPVFNKFIELKKYLYQNRNESGMNAVKDSINDLLYPPTLENPKEDLDFYTNMKYEDLSRIYNMMYGDASLFTFAIVGGITKEEAKRLVECYIASLPGKAGSAPLKTYPVKDTNSSAKEIVKEFQADIKENIGEVELSFMQSEAFTQREAKALTLLKELLQFRLFEELREKEHGIYSVSVDASYQQAPFTLGTLKIHFSTSRENVSHMKQRTYEIIEEIRRNAFSEDTFKSIKIPLVFDEEAESNQVENDNLDSNNPMLWLAILNAYMERGIASTEIANEQVFIKDITREEVVRVLDKLLTDAKKRDITVKSMPETY